MPTEAPPDTVQTMTDQERHLLLQLGKVADKSPAFLMELARLAKGRHDTHQAAMVVVPAVEAEPNQRISLAQAIELFERKINAGKEKDQLPDWNLRALLADLVEARFNAARAIAGRGTILSDAYVEEITRRAWRVVHSYRALLRKATISQEDFERIEKGELHF